MAQDDTTTQSPRGPNAPPGSECPDPNNPFGPGGPDGPPPPMRGRTWTPWLVIQYDTADKGQRPIPSGQPFWTSPRIRVEPTDSLGNPVAGQQTYVRVRIFNLGKAMARPVRVDFWWGNPAVGLGPGQMSPIGTEWVEIDAHRTFEVRCTTPWVPIVENNGHECLVVNSSAAINDPITAPFQPVPDRHVGQRNVHVDSAGPGGTVTLTVEMANLLDERTPVTLASRVQHLAVLDARGLGLRDLVDAAATFVNRPSSGSSAVTEAPRLEDVSAARGTPAVLADLSSSPVAGPAVVTGFSAARLRAVAPALAGGVVRTLQVVPLGPGERRRVDLQLTVPSDARPGEFVVFHLTEAGQGLLLGGYTVVVQVAS